MTFLKTLLLILLISMFLGTMLSLVVVLGNFLWHFSTILFIGAVVIFNIIGVPFGYAYIGMCMSKLERYPIVIFLLTLPGYGLLVLISIVVAWSLDDRIIPHGQHLYIWGMALGCLWAVIDAFRGKLVYGERDREEEKADAENIEAKGKLEQGDEHAS